MPTAERTWRAAGLVAFAAVAAAVAYGLFYTPFGRTITHDPTAAADAVRRCVGDRPVVAPLAFVAGYVVLATLCLPIWWLQVLAGVAFGLWGGGVLCVVGSATGAAVTSAAAAWMAGPWFHARVESKMARLRWIDGVLGHNPLLTVMTLRLTHLVPFGVSNVALGLIGVSPWVVLVGTAIGNVPAVALYVGVGAGWVGWRFWAAVVAINVVLLVPLFARLVPLLVRLWRARADRRRGFAVGPPGS